MGFCVFRGLTSLNLDTKGRMGIPVRYRSVLLGNANTLIVTIDPEDPCLLIYPLAEWETIEAQLAQLPTLNPAARAIQRLLLGHAAEIEMDPQGRILLPAPLREHALLEKNIVLLGQGRKFEIWSEARWAEARKQSLATYSNEEDVLQNLVL